MFRSLILSVALLAAACRAGEAQPMTTPSLDPSSVAQEQAPREVMGLWDVSDGQGVCRLALRIAPVAGGYDLFLERCGGELAQARLWRFAQDAEAGAIELVAAGGAVTARLRPLGPDDWAGEAASGAGLRMVRAVEH